MPQAPLVNATVCLRPDDGEGEVEGDGFVAMMDGVGEVCGAGGGVVEPSPEDLANLIYTSGATRKPKGVGLIHSNTVSNVMGVRGEFIQTTVVIRALSSLL